MARSRHTRPVAAAAALVIALAPAAALAAPSSATAVRHVARPTGLVVVGHRALEWKPVSASGFAIEQAANHAMNSSVVHYTIRGPGYQFTPYGLTKGTTYYFRVRTLRAGHHSAWTPVVSFAPKTREQAATVMTYNILQTTGDGRREGGNVVAPWALRLPKAVALIKQAAPDLIAVEEGAKWVSAPGGGRERQISSLVGGIGTPAVAGLGAPYALARTEIPPNEPHYSRTGVNIVYNRAVYATVGAGNHVDVGDTRWAAYQEFRNRATGAKILFIATHLLDGTGHSYDVRRLAEAKHLFKFGNGLAHKRGVPVVYGGDFNSAHTNDKNFTLDGAGVAARAAHMADAMSVAQKRIHGSYDSANSYKTTPVHSSDDIDHLFTSPGVGVQTGEIDIHLRNGKFVGVIPSDHNPVVAKIFYAF